MAEEVRPVAARLVDRKETNPLAPDERAERIPFDFEAHRKAAIEQYNRRRDLYHEFADTIRSILADTIKSRSLGVNDIQMRVKEGDSFGKKG